MFGHKKQAMAICYAFKSNDIEFLLVKTRKGKRRTFPKGAVKKDEMPWLTAVREAYEEAGVLGEATHEPLTVSPLTKRGKTRMVEAYLLRVGTTGLKHEKRRDARWFKPEDAQEELSINRSTDDANELSRVVRLACRVIEHLPTTGPLIDATVASTKPIRVFVSYSHQDKKYLARNSLLGYVSGGLESEGFEFWYDKRIAAGEMWDDVIRNEIKRTDMALLFVSQAFLNSEFCRNHEVREFLKARTRAGLIIIPIILSHCDWVSYEWLARTQAIPSEGESISRNYIGEGKRFELFSRILLELRQKGRVIRERRSRETRS